MPWTTIISLIILGQLNNFLALGDLLGRTQHGTSLIAFWIGILPVLKRSHLIIWSIHYFYSDCNHFSCFFIRYKKAYHGKLTLKLCLFNFQPPVYVLSWLEFSTASIKYGANVAPASLHVNYFLFSQSKGWYLRIYFINVIHLFWCPLNLFLWLCYKYFLEGPCDWNSMPIVDQSFILSSTKFYLPLFASWNLPHLVILFTALF